MRLVLQSVLKVSYSCTFSVRDCIQREREQHTPREINRTAQDNRSRHRSRILRLARNRPKIEAQIRHLGTTWHRPRCRIPSPGHVLRPWDSSIIRPHDRRVQRHGIPVRIEDHARARAGACGHTADGEEHLVDFPGAGAGVDVDVGQGAVELGVVDFAEFEGAGVFAAEVAAEDGGVEEGG